MIYSQRTTRRSFLTGAAATLLGASVSRAQSSTPVATPEAFSWPEPIELGNGLLVVDWRLYPSEDMPRFILEVHNASDEIRVAPVVGVIPHVDSTESGWGTPYTSIINPGESTFVFGIAPSGSEAGLEWDQAEFVRCDDPVETSHLLEDALEWDVQLEYEVESPNPDLLRAQLKATNNRQKETDQLTVVGHVRDLQGRICGGMATSNLGRMDPGEHIEFIVNAQPTLDIPANPFVLQPDMSGCTAEFSVQPRRIGIPQGCPAVMPWNR